jgi:hypothetical protein
MFLNLFMFRIPDFRIAGRTPFGAFHPARAGSEASIAAAVGATTHRRLRESVGSATSRPPIRAASWRDPFASLSTTIPLPEFIGKAAPDQTECLTRSTRRTHPASQDLDPDSCILQAARSGTLETDKAPVASARTGLLAPIEHDRRRRSRSAKNLCFHDRKTIEPQSRTSIATTPDGRAFPIDDDVDDRAQAVRTRDHEASSPAPSAIASANISPVSGLRRNASKPASIA